MRYLSPLFIILATAPCLAQSSISLKGSATTSTSRGNIGTGAGEIHMGLHTSHWRGIGDNGAKCNIVGFRSALQDQDASTQESYEWVIRSGTDIDGPVVGAAGELHRFGPLKMPSVPAGGARAWMLSTTLAKPVSIPCAAHVSVGIALTKQAQWPADGMSCHIATGVNSSQHANADDMAWQIVDGIPAATHPSAKRAWSHSILLDRPTLQMSIAGKKSIGGMFPESGLMYAGYVSGAEARATSLLFLGVDAQRRGFPLVPGTARLYLGFTKIKLLGVARVNAGGNAAHVLGKVPSRAPIDTLWLQAAVIGTRDHMTNAQATTFDR
jgi:hypothetical protein